MNLIPYEPSEEGAYDLAIEAAAGRIHQLVAGDRSLSSNSGYSSDAETEDTATTLEGDEGEDSSLTETSFNRADSPIESSDSSSVSSGGSEDIDAEIAYLKLKQKILEKASTKLRQENAFIAYNAYGILRGDFSRESKLWSEAKCVLDVLKKESNSFSSSDDDSHKRKASSPRPALRNMAASAAKRPKIDLSNVEKVSAGSLRGSMIPARSTVSDHTTSTMGVSTPKVSTIAVPSSVSHWIPQAMVHQIPALVSRNADKSMDVMLDPNVGLMVVSPNHIPFRNGIQLTKALEFTNSAQIIALSTPPFSIVHANKAFCEVSGLTHADVIGKPVDEILRMEQDIPSALRGIDSPPPLKSRFRISDQKACQIHVDPITDRSQNTRGMTHILVKIDNVVGNSSDTVDGSVIRKIVAGKGSNADKQQSTDGSTSREERAPVGTTGSHKVTIG
ncbi:MAG: hypothetical protein SGILL_001079 [Bacillariaceae sp.]